MRLLVRRDSQGRLDCRGQRKSVDVSIELRIHRNGRLDLARGGVGVELDIVLAEEALAFSELFQAGKRSAPPVEGQAESLTRRPRRCTVAPRSARSLRNRHPAGAMAEPP